MIPENVTLLNTKAIRRNGQPSLNLNHAVNMRKASKILEPLPLPVKRGNKFIDRTGRTYGELFVIGFAGKNRLGQSNWLCRCSCETICVVFGGNLNGDHTTSCGCKKERGKHRESGQGRTLGRSQEYQAMASMIQRCLNPNSPAYKRYGAKGITVCEEWNSLWKFDAFLAHMGRAPTPRHSIDRWPNLKGNYEPGNVRWATQPEQMRNTSRNVWITFRGQTLCRRDMASKYGMSNDGLKKRLAKGMSVEDALTTPINTKMWNTKRRTE